MRRLLEFSLLGIACCAAQPVIAQEGSRAVEEIRVVPVENVKIDYAQVMRVEPVYQTLRATRTEERCDPLPEPAAPARKRDEPGVFSRMVDSVRGLFSREDAATAPVAPRAPAKGSNCRIVQVGREFQRPIAYDVDYVYKGTRYRSRLAEDPGNRLRLRVSVTPWETEAQPLATP
jgi:uncharacterized protein YcfJ